MPYPTRYQDMGRNLVASRWANPAITVGLPLFSVEPWSLTDVCFDWLPEDDGRPAVRHLVVEERVCCGFSGSVRQLPYKMTVENCLQMRLPILYTTGTPETVTCELRCPNGSGPVSYVLYHSSNHGKSPCCYLEPCTSMCASCRSQLHPC